MLCNSQELKSTTDLNNFTFCATLSDLSLNFPEKNSQFGILEMRNKVTTPMKAKIYLKYRFRSKRFNSKFGSV